MSLPPGRFSQLRFLQTLVCVLAMISGGVLIGVGLLGIGADDNTGLRIAFVAAGGFVIFLAIVVLAITALLVKMESSSARECDALSDLSEKLARQTKALELIEENTRISDAAKSLAHRSEEIEALHQAIREDVRHERWDAGFQLIKEVEKRFGYQDEADELRRELMEGRSLAIDGKLSEALALIESHFKEYDWERAANEIERLQRALPDDDRVKALDGRIDQQKDQHKKELHREWELAVQRSDTDHAIEVLRELDQYLTADEAEELKTTARSVFKEKLLQLGIQFRFAVKEKRWQDALDIGLELIREFPNARMAHEVQEMLEMLRHRAHPASDRETAGGSGK